MARAFRTTNANSREQQRKNGAKTGEAHRQMVNAPKLMTPAVKGSIGEDIVEKYGYDPAETIANIMKEMKELYESKKDTLTFKEKMEYFRTSLATSEKMVTYQYARKAIEHKSEKAVVKVDYNQMIESLHNKTLGKDVAAGIGEIQKRVDRTTQKIAGPIIDEIEEEQSIVSEQ